MPRFYDLYNEGDLEVGELTPYGLEDYESMIVSDDQDAVDCVYDDSLVVEEEDNTSCANDMVIPGSDMEFVEVSDEDTMEVREKNWEEDKSHSRFLDYITNKINNIPRHSGNTVPGCERALAYLKSCESEISRAMRSDLGGEIDEEQVDKLRKQIHGMADMLDRRVDQLTKTAGVQQVSFISEGQCSKCESTAPMWNDALSEVSICMNCEAKEEHGLSKAAGTARLQVFMTPFERAVVGTIINATISGGKNLEETYEKMKNKYNFSPREELSFQQLIADHGYPIYKDRGLLNEPTDPASGDNVEWQTNYQA